jgi:hypothetical protein
MFSVNELEKKQTTDQNSYRNPKMYVGQNIRQPLTVLAIVGGLHALIMTSTSRSIIAVVSKAAMLGHGRLCGLGVVVQVVWPRATRPRISSPCNDPAKLSRKISPQSQ